MLWDKVLDIEDREQLIRQHWIAGIDDLEDAKRVATTSVMHAENMSDKSILKLKEAFAVSPRTRYFQRKLAKIDNDIKKKWDKLCRMNTANWIHDLHILPHGIAQNNVNRDYEKLSFTVKQLLRSMYNPTTGKFDPLKIFGIYADGTGV